MQYVLTLYIFYIWNPYNISSRYPSYTIMFFQFILLINFIIYLYFTKKKLETGTTTGNMINLENKDMVSYGMVLLCFVTLFATLYYIWKFSLNIQSFQTLYIYLIDFLIICGFIGILYLVIQNTETPKGLDGISGYVMLIPFLLVTLSSYIRKEFTTVTESVWILLFIEILLILFRLLLPNIIHYLTSHDKSSLLGSPIYLNNERVLGKNESIDLIEKKKFLYNYSVSFWFYINPQPPNTRSSYNKYANILNYGNKPRIQFHSKDNKLRVQCVKKDETITTIYETTELQYQKWNNIVINYDAGSMDVFINGDLVGSKDNIAPFMTHEKIYSGEKRGIEGGICNVNYYEHIQSQSVISNTYQLLKNNEIPYIY